MKKIIALLACLTMLLSMAACGASDTTDTTTTAPTTAPTTEAPTTETPTENNEAPTDAPTTEGTVGQQLLAIFKADATGTAEEVANRIVEAANLPFAPMVMPMESGYLNGLDCEEVTGFEQCATFAPMIGTIPFVGYIFTLADGADVEAFKTMLSDNANLRWNICTAADELVVESEGNTVFFLMCPASLEQPEDEFGDDMGLEGELPEGDMPIEDMPAEDAPAMEGTVGSNLLAEFMVDPTGTPEEIANRIIASPILTFGPMVTPVEPGYLTGFDNTEITGFESAVTFAPMIGTIPFVGYIFTLADGADVEAFKTTLINSANLRWNICTAADEMVVESQGNTVFFLMCPTTFEQPEEDMGNDMGMEEALPEMDMPIDEMPEV